MPIYIDKPLWERSIALAKAVLARLMRDPQTFRRRGVDRYLTTSAGDKLTVHLRFMNSLRGIPAEPIQWTGPQSFEGRDEEFMQRFCMLLVKLNGRLVATLFWDQVYVSAGLDPGPWEQDLLDWAMDLTPR